MIAHLVRKCGAIVSRHGSDRYLGTSLCQIVQRSLWIDTAMKYGPNSVAFHVPKLQRARLGLLVLHGDLEIRQPSLIAKFMGPTWGPPGADRTCQPQVGPCWPHEPCYLGYYMGYLNNKTGKDSFNYTVYILLTYVIFSVLASTLYGLASFELSTV